jgi:hypothetical protein
LKNKSHLAVIIKTHPNKKKSNDDSLEIGFKCPGLKW